MIEVNEATIQEFIKLLIEAGGVYRIQDDHTIWNTVSDDQVCIVPATSNTKKPLAVFYDSAPVTNDVFWLQPFQECVGRDPGREWFFNTLSYQPAYLLKSLVLKLIEDITGNVDEYEEFRLMSKIRKLVTDKTSTEIKGFPVGKFLSIFYNKGKKTACAQTEIFDEDFRDGWKKVSPKTWQIFDILFTEIFGSTDLDGYTYTAKLLDIPETEAKLNIAVSLFSALEDPVKDILKLELHAAELKAHLQVLGGYAKLYAWVACNNTEPPKPQPTQPSWMPQQPQPNQFTMPTYGQPGYFGTPNFQPPQPASIPVSMLHAANVQRQQMMNQQMMYQQPYGVPMPNAPTYNGRIPLGGPR